VAQILNGTALAKEIQSEILQATGELKNKGIIPKLAVILVGADPGSVWYAKNKANLGKKLGVAVEIHHLADTVAESEVIELIERLNRDRLCHGILVELPLPEEFDKTKVMNEITPAKDIDGVTAINRGLIFGGREEAALVPATPLSCLKLIAAAGVDLQGKRVTLVGRGDTVGRPLMAMLVNRSATVTVCHSKSLDLAGECLRAEIIVAAVGVPHLISAAMVGPGAIVIDAGINEVESGKFTGDVDFEPALAKASAITPVPGGVGSLTTTLILKNLLIAIERLQQEEGEIIDVV
jgi:methylenetetrahydrofolate dehydrogenase (NADP+)/methenyltetrahydrofolate cyclohydrolase